MEISVKSLQNVCRACKTELKEFRYSLFAADNLSELFATCTSLHINKNDGHPSAVCSLCYQLMMSFYRFRTMCVNSYGKFQEILDARIKTEIPENLSDSSPDDVVQVKIEMPDPVDYEQMADQSHFEEQPNADLEIKEEKVQENYWYSNNENDNSMDADQNDGEEKYDRNLEGTSKGTNEVYNCHLCEKKFYKQRYYEGHLREHEGLKIPNKKNREEILQRKREAERKRRQRIKEDPLLNEKLRKKEHLKYLKKKQEKKILSIKDMSAVNQIKQRKIWRKAQQNRGTKRRKELERVSIEIKLKDGDSEENSNKQQNKTTKNDTNDLKITKQKNQKSR